MKKRSLATRHLTVTLLVTLTLTLSLSIAAQQGVTPEKSQRSASLETSLGQLERDLKESVALDFRHRFARRTYVRLKQRGGCNISLQVSQVPSSSYVNHPDRPATDLSLAEWRINLTDLDAAEVKVERPANGDYRVIRFATLAGKESIKWNGFGVGDVKWTSGGRLDVGEKQAPQVAAALQQAIVACR